MSTGPWPPPGPGPQMPESTGVQPPWSRTAYELRPLSLGEILDRTFGVYKAFFWLFAGIGALSGAVQLIANAIQLLVYHGIQVHRPATFNINIAALERQTGAVVGTLIYYLAAAVTQAATVWALSEVYLGRPATIFGSVRAVMARWLRFVGIGIWQAWSFMWLPTALVIVGAVLLPRARLVWLGGTFIFLGVTGGFTFGAIAFIRNSLAVQAAVVEGVKVRPAMRRSKTLAAGAKGRIFVVFLITLCLYMVVGMLNTPLTLFVGMGALRGEQHVLAQAAMLVVNSVGHTLVAPVAMIGLSLVYFDQRVRQEALDLMLMLGGSANNGTPSGTEPSASGNPPQALGAAGDATAF